MSSASPLLFFDFHLPRYYSFYRVCAQRVVKVPLPPPANGHVSDVLTEEQIPSSASCCPSVLTLDPFCLAVFRSRLDPPIFSDVHVALMHASPPPPNEERKQHEKKHHVAISPNFPPKLLTPPRLRVSHTLRSLSLKARRRAWLRHTSHPDSGSLASIGTSIWYSLRMDAYMCVS